MPSSPQTVSQRLRLCALAFTAFTVQTDDFVVVGVLPQIAADLHVTETAAGQLVTVFSLVYAVFGPVFALSLDRHASRRILSCGLAVFCLTNLAVLVVQSYLAIVLLRVCAALAAAAVLPTVLGLAAQGSQRGAEGRDLATVMVGVSASIVLGVPLGTWVGAAFGWRATFVLGAMLGMVALAAVRTTVPTTELVTAMTLHQRLRALAFPAVHLASLAIVIVTLGNLALQTYVAPFLRELGGVEPVTLGTVLAVAGVAGVLAGRLGGTLVDRFGTGRSFAVASGLFTLAMGFLGLAWVFRPVPVAFVIGPVVVWSGSAWAMPTPLQMLVLQAAHGTANSRSALALASSAVAVGAATGSGIGGVVLSRLGAGALPVAAAFSAVLAGVPFLLASRVVASPAWLNRVASPSS